jgi:RNA exonuclease 4
MSNWQHLQKRLTSSGLSVKVHSKKSTVSKHSHRIEEIEQSKEETEHFVETNEIIHRKTDEGKAIERIMRKKVVALDCEMVGLGEKGKESALARCSVVDFEGNVLYDQIIRPKGFVTDFRTKWSGIKKSDLRKDKDNVVTLEECQESVAQLLKDKILVGHALQNDFNVLLLSHPRSKIRDTSHYHPYMRVTNSGKHRPRSLKELTREFLGKQIQTGEHDSVEDARMTMLLYRRELENWENSLTAKKTENREKSKQSAVPKLKGKKLLKESITETEPKDLSLLIEEDEKNKIKQKKKTNISLAPELLNRLLQNNKKLEDKIHDHHSHPQQSISHLKRSRNAREEEKEEEDDADEEERQQQLGILSFEEAASSSKGKNSKPAKHSNKKRKIRN